MEKIIVNNKKFNLEESKKNHLIYQYCYKKGIEIPCFCYKKNLKIVVICLLHTFCRVIINSLEGLYSSYFCEFLKRNILKIKNKKW